MVIEFSFWFSFSFFFRFILYFARLLVMFASRKLLSLESKNKRVYFVLCSLTRNFAERITHIQYVRKL